MDGKLANASRSLYLAVASIAGLFFLAQLTTPVRGLGADQDRTPTVTPYRTPTPTATATITIPLTRTPFPPEIYFPRLWKDTGWIGPATISSDCARIDRRPGSDEFAVCALGGSCRNQSGDDVCGPCLVTVSVTTNGCIWGPESLSLVLDPDPMFRHPLATTVAISADSSRQFVIPSHLVRNRTVYTATVVRSCSGVITSRVIGQFGLCDPGGSIRVITRIGAAPVNVEGATVTLKVLQGSPWDGPGAVAPIDHLPDNCYNRLTRPGAALAPPMVGGIPNPYWNPWSGVPTPTPPSIIAVDSSGPFGLGETNPASSNASGNYGWMVAPDGCYVVEVDPRSASKPSYATALPTAWSPVVASFVSPHPGHAVGELDLTYYYNPQAGPGRVGMQWTGGRAQAVEFNRRNRRLQPD